MLSSFYQWAVAEGHAGEVPFGYVQAQVRYGDVRRDAQVNLARRRVPKRHVTIRCLEAGFGGLFMMALRRATGPDGTPDGGYRGRELAAATPAVGKMALASGLRGREFGYLLASEVPEPLPPSPGRLPGPVPGPSGVAKGRKFRTTWIDHTSLEAVPPLRGPGPGRSGGRVAVAAAGEWGEPLMVDVPPMPAGTGQSAAVPVGIGWTRGQRRRLVAPDGRSCLLSGPG